MKEETQLFRAQTDTTLELGIQTVVRMLTVLSEEHQTSTIVDSIYLIIPIPLDQNLTNQTINTEEGWEKVTHRMVVMIHMEDKEVESIIVIEEGSMKVEEESDNQIILEIDKVTMAMEET